MQQLNDQHIIRIPATIQIGHIFELNNHVCNQAHVQVIIEPNAIVTIRDSGKPVANSVEIMVGTGAQLFWITDSVYDDMHIHCAARSSVHYMQVIGRSLTARVQKITLSMQEEEAQASVRIFPFLSQKQQVKCITTQQHSSSATSTDLRIIGRVDGKAQFEHKGMITVNPCLGNIDIVQKTVMFLSGPHVNAYARPSFDIASKDVHCTHGAALGALDENNVWALQARGIDYASAVRLIIEARCLACLDKEISVQMYELVRSMIVANQ